MRGRAVDSAIAIRGLAIIAAACATAATRGAQAVSIPFTLEDNRLFVEARANGQGPFAFIVDTGSDGSSISAELLKRLTLQPVATSTAGGAGESEVAETDARLDSLAIGPVEMGPLKVASLSYDSLKRAIGFRRFDGVIGSELFDRFVVTLAFDRSRLNLDPPAAFHAAPGAIAVPFALNDADMPVVDGMIAGIAGRFEIDTGDRSAVTLFGPFWRRHRLDRMMSPSVVAMTGYGVGGPIRGIVGRMTGFKLGGVECAPPIARLSLQKSGAFAGADAAGSIGIGILGQFTVSFDYSRKTMYLAPRDGPPPAAAYDRAGVWLGVDDADAITVLDTVAGGPAEAAGLKAGDRVVALDGGPVSGRDLFATRRKLQERGLERATIRTLRAGSAADHVVTLRDLIAPAG